MKKISNIGILAVCAVALGAASANAQIIQDTFSYPPQGGNNYPGLNGEVPDTTENLGDAWTANNNWAFVDTTIGQGVSRPYFSNSSSAYLPLDVSVPGIYTYSLDVSNQSTTWTAIGFLNSTASNVGTSNPFDGYSGYLLLNPDGSYQAFENILNFTANGSGTLPLGSPTVTNLELQLNTLGKNDVLSAYIDGTQINLGGSNGNYTYLTNPTIDSIGVATYQNGSANIDNLLVTYSPTAISETPEPSTWAMMVGGVAVLIFMQRRASSRKA